MRAAASERPPWGVGGRGGPFIALIESALGCTHGHAGALLDRGRSGGVAVGGRPAWAACELFVAALAVALAAMRVPRVLGNWERPSSFSLLTKHVPEQLWLGVAALAVGERHRRHWRLLARSGSWVATTSGRCWRRRWGGRAGVHQVRSARGHRPVGRPDGARVRARAAVVALAALLVTFARPGDGAASGLLPRPTRALSARVRRGGGGNARPRADPARAGDVGERTARHGAGRRVAFEERTKMAPRGRATATRCCARLPSLGVGSELIALVAAGLDVSVQGRLADTTRFAAEFTMRGFETVGAWIALAAAADRAGRRGRVGRRAWWRFPRQCCCRVASARGGSWGTRRCTRG